MAVVGPALLVLAGVVWMVDVSSQAALEASLGRRLVSVAHGAAALLPGRVVLLGEGDDDRRTARSARKKLAELAAATGVPRLVVATERGVVVDSAGERRIGEPYLRAAADAFELSQVLGGDAVASLLFEGPEGRPHKSGYAPFRHDGAIVGYVAATAPADYTEALDRLRARLWGGTAVGLGILIVLASTVGRWVAVPLSRLAAAARRIGEGELQTKVAVEGPHEARVLATTMNRMTEALRARDIRLQMMLSGIAHEVRNPLGGIELFGGLLHEDLDAGDPRRNHVDRILSELRTLSKVVNDFLEYARERPPELNAHRAEDLLRDAWEMTACEAPFRLEDHSGGGSVRVDGDRMRRALMNLLQNGAQAAEGGEVAASVADAGEELVLSIEDAGPGIDPAIRPQIFEPFFTTRQKGTGLGLALVNKTVSEVGGRVELGDSIRLGGARFEIRLPKSAAAR